VFGNGQMIFLSKINKNILHSTQTQKETAIILAVIPQKQSAAQTKDYLNELQFLAETAGIQTIGVFTQKLERADLNTYLGKGRFEEVMAFVKDKEVDIILYDDDLSPRQVKNIEGAFEKEGMEVKVVDRSLLILNIFALRAQTQQAKTQVELAQYQYMLPRLTRMWTHLSRQRGGAMMRGPGEKELETDRRIANDRIVWLKDKLKNIEKQSVTQRKNRERLVRVALVGYTNVGKSTLMRRLAKAEVFAENKLFATVDSTVRKVNIDNLPFLLTDTVGFIRKLPTTLIESFKSTLDEVREADILLHVVDISHSGFEEQIQVVNTILNEIGAGNKPTVMVFNKIDLLPANDEPPEALFEDEQEKEDLLQRLKRTFMNTDQPKAVFISAENNDNLAELRSAMMHLLKDKHLSIFPNWLG
jgi:GTPase